MEEPKMFSSWRAGWMDAVRPLLGSFEYQYLFELIELEVQGFLNS